MNEIWPLIWITAVAGMGGTGLGGVITCLFRKDSNKTVSLLLSFAAGVMIAVVCFDLLTEALNAGNRVHLWLVSVFVLVGYGTVSLLNKWVEKATFHKTEQNGGGRPQTVNDLFMAGIVMAMAIALHNVPEGMVIGASFAAAKEQFLSNRSGLAIAIVIGLHNIPEGMAVAVPLISGGMKKWRAVVLTALSGSPTILGAVLGYLIGGINKTALIISLSFASGAMLYVVFAELLPESIEKWNGGRQTSLAAVIGILVGLIIVYV